MALNGYGYVDKGYNSVVKRGDMTDPQLLWASNAPLGFAGPWFKTLGTADSGTTTGTTAFKLIQSGQNFQTTVRVGMVVRNTTDATWSYVVSVDSDTQLTLEDDIMVSGEGFVVYKTPFLPYGWVECNGQVLSDADSPFDGETMPDMNTTKRFVRGSLTSGSTGGADINTHTHTVTTGDKAVGNPGVTRAAQELQVLTSSAPSDTNNMPAYMEAVWIIRVK